LPFCSFYFQWADYYHHSRKWQHYSQWRWRSGNSTGIYGPNGMAFDTSGNIYISEYYSNVIRMISPSGIITTVAGVGLPGYSGDGGPATNAQLFRPLKIFLDASNNLFIADQLNNCIRKINPSGIISTFAGNGTGGFNGDGIAATSAELNQPSGITQDQAGNYYIADYLNYRIRKVNGAGIISTIAGNGIAGYSGDGGTSTGASINGGFGVTFDGSGNLYIAEHYNNIIRKVSSIGIISTIAGTGSGSFSGDGGQATAAELNYPGSVAFDNFGNLFIADELNFRIRMITPAGIISTYAGIGTGGFSGDGGPATAAMIENSNELKFDALWHLILSDNNNNRVREIIDSGCMDFITTQPLNDTVFAGDTAKFNVLTSMPAPSYQWQEDAGTGFGSLINVWPYSGVNTNTLIIQATSHLLNATHYRCIITSESSPCADTSNPAILIIKSGVGVGELQTAEVHIFPDPAHDHLTISIHGNTVAGNIQLFNELGQQILEQKLTGSIAELTISELPAGMYILRVSIGDQVIVRKVFKD